MLNNKTLKILLDDLILELENKFVNNFTGLVLFGSHAKNTQNENSDLDLLITFKKLPKSKFERTDLIIDVVLDFEEKYNITINPILVAENKLNSSILIIDIAEYAKVLIDKSKKINYLFEKIKDSYKKGIYKKLFKNDYYILNLENV